MVVFLNLGEVAAARIMNPYHLRLNAYENMQNWSHVDFSDFFPISLSHLPRIGKSRLSA